MKKIIAIGLILLLVLLAGCKKTEPAKTPEKEQGQAPEGEKIQAVSKSQIKFSIQDAMEGKDDRIKIEPVEPTMEAGFETEEVEVQ